MAEVDPGFEPDKENEPPVSAPKSAVPEMSKEKLAESKKERTEDREKATQKFRAEAQKTYKVIKKTDPKTKHKEKPWVEKQVKEKVEEYDLRELVKLEDLANRIPFDKKKLAVLRKRIAVAKKKLDKNPVDKKRRLLEDIEEQRQRKFYLEREKILLTGEKGHISDFKTKLEDNKKKSKELALRKVELENEKLELAKVSQILEQIELTSRKPETPVKYDDTELKTADFPHKFMDIGFRNFKKYSECGESTVLELLLRRYAEDLETLGTEFFSKSGAKELEMEDEEGTLNQHIRNKQVNLKALEDKRKEFHKKTADLSKQIGTFSEGHDKVMKEVEELGVKLRDMERGHREQVGEVMEEDPKAAALHGLLEEATRKLSDSHETRNNVIIGVLLSYNSIKPISYRDADGKKAEPFQAAINQIPWQKIDQQLTELKEMFINLIKEFKDYETKFLNAKKEANIKNPVKEEQFEDETTSDISGPAKKKSKGKVTKPRKKRVKKEV